MKSIRAYYLNRDNGNTLELTTVTTIGSEYVTKLGVPISATGTIEKLIGWPDESAEIYVTHLGDEFLVPVK